MAAPASRRVRAALGALALAGTLGLASCSSSSPAPIPGAPVVAANGKHYVYAPGAVARSSWPKVCTLLARPSAAAAIGTAVTTKAFHQRCFYIPSNDAFPTLTLTTLAIGSGQRDVFTRARDANARLHPVSVDGVGKAAVLYDLRTSPTVTLDLLADQGVFELALRSPVGNVTGATQARDILVRVGKAIASEFAG